MIVNFTELCVEGANISTYIYVFIIKVCVCVHVCLLENGLLLKIG